MYINIRKEKNVNQEKKNGRWQGVGYNNST